MGKLIREEKYEYKSNIYTIQVLEYELGFETNCLNNTTNERMPVRWAMHYKEYNERFRKETPDDLFRSIVNGSKRTIRWFLGDESFPI